MLCTLLLKVIISDLPFLLLSQRLSWGTLYPLLCYHIILARIHSIRLVHTLSFTMLSQPFGSCTLYASRSILVELQTLVLIPEGFLL